MSIHNVAKRTGGFASAVGLSAAAVMAVPAPSAQAADCVQFGFPGPVTINVTGSSNPPDPEFNFTFGAITNQVGDPGAQINNLEGAGFGTGSKRGTMTGSIGGTSTRDVYLVFTPDDGSAAIQLGGSVSKAGIASGGIGGRGNVGNWTATPAMRCMDAELAPAAPAEPAAPAVPAAPAEPAAPATPTATVISDVDVYDVPGGVGEVTGILRADETVQLAGCMDDNWCHVTGGGVPTGDGWVWGDFLQH